MDKNVLERLLSTYNWWMEVSTVAVAVGILGEYVAHFVFEKESRRHKSEVAATILFGVLVLGGVVGEFIVGKRLSEATESLQRIADTEIAAANERAASAENETARLAQRLADRHITLDERERMLAILKMLSGSRVAVTYITPSGSDTQEYSIEIAAVFRDAKWVVLPHPWLTSMDRALHGFAVEVRQKGSPSNSNLIGAAATKALAVLDDRISLTKGGSDPDPNMKLDLMIFVGSK